MNKERRLSFFHEPLVDRFFSSLFKYCVYQKLANTLNNEILSLLQGNAKEKTRRKEK